MSSKMTMSQLQTKLLEASKKSKKITPLELKKFAQVGVGLMKSEIQRMHAVDTSAMLNSVTTQTENANTVLIGPTVSYAPYVALGTSRMAARPFHETSAVLLNAKISGYNISVKEMGL